MNIVEPIADAVTGGVYANAAEPRAGIDASGHTTEQACLNCQTPLVGDYCHACGQRGHVHRSLSAFGHDLLHGVFHFEGKIWRTVPMLLFKPGELTRRYIAGERAGFVSPVAIYLFTVFLMFAMVSAVGGPASISPNLPSSPAERAKVEQEFAEKRSIAQREIAQLQAERARLGAAGADTAQLNKRIGNKERDLRIQEELFGTAMAVAGGDKRATTGDTPALDVASKLSEENAVLIGGADRLNRWFNGAYRKAKENPSLLLYKLQNNGYKYSWALIPLSVPFVWLMFLHRRSYRQFGAYDHTVFVTYSITFMSLGVILLTLMRLVGLPNGAVAAAIAFIPPVHMYKQLRGAYSLSRFSALWRTVALVFFAILASGLFATLLLVVGVLG